MLLCYESFFFFFSVFGGEKAERRTLDAIGRFGSEGCKRLGGNHRTWAVAMHSVINLAPFHNAALLSLGSEPAKAVHHLSHAAHLAEAPGHAGSNIGFGLLKH